MTRKIIEALTPQKPINSNSFTDRLTKKIEIPSYDISIHLLTDGSGATEVLLTDKESGELFCKYLYPSQEAFNAYMAQAFAPPEDTGVYEQQGHTLRIIECKLY